MVAPGITIRDRLQVLQPSNPENYYRQRDILPTEQIARLGEARIAIINYHQLMPKEKHQRRAADERDSKQWQGSQCLY